MADKAALQRLVQQQPDTIFHLASVPGGAAERDPALGRSVNLDATLDLMEACQHLARPPRLVHASSIAVYGDAWAHSASEDMLPSPGISYGAHKLACETMLADASRRGWIDGCSVRLPGIVARRDENPGLASSFMSEVFWRLAEHRPIILPVSPTGTCWWMSVRTCVRNLIHMAGLDSGAWACRRIYQMPVLHLGMDELVQALARRFGADAQALVRYAPDPFIDQVFARYPPLSTPRAELLRLCHDGDVDTLIRNVFALE